METSAFVLLVIFNLCGVWLSLLSVCSNHWGWVRWALGVFCSQAACQHHFGSWENGWFSLLRLPSCGRGLVDTKDRSEASFV